MFQNYILKHIIIYIIYLSFISSHVQLIFADNTTTTTNSVSTSTNTKDTNPTDAAGEIIEAIITGAELTAEGFGTFMNKLGCDTVRLEYISNMFLGIDASIAINNRIKGGAMTDNEICVINGITLKGELLAYKVLNKMRQSAKKAKNPYTFLLDIAVASTVLAFLGTVIGLWGSAREIATDNHICYDTVDENHPLPYTDEQIKNLIGETSEAVTDENIEDKYKKICIRKKDGSIIWLKRGECNGSYSSPICAQNMSGYSYIICAYTPRACPCIMNIQYGTTKIPQYKRDSNGNILTDEEGDPIFDPTIDEVKKYFLRHCRILKFKELPPYVKEDVKGIIDDSCYDLKGYSKRKFPLTGGIAQCFFFTARNIFEKPIFTFSSTIQSTNKVIEQYNKELSFLRDKISSIITIYAGGDYKTLETDQQKVVDNLINDILNYPTFEPEYSSYIDKNPKQIPITLGKKYSCPASSIAILPSQSIKTTTSETELQEAIDKQYGKSNNITAKALRNSEYHNCINRQDIPSNYETSVIDSINKYKLTVDKNASINSKDTTPESITESLTSLQTEIGNKKESYSRAINLTYNNSNKNYAQYTFFDRFNNQIKVICIILLTLWVFNLGYRMLMGEIELSQSALTKLAMQVIFGYYFVFSNAWKEFLFAMIMSVMQAIAAISIDITSMPSTATAVACNYESSDKNPYITRPNYEQIYKPYTYTSPTNSTKIETLDVYCTDGTKASLIFNSQIGSNVFYCSNSANPLEEGYRPSELKKAGFSLSQYFANQTTVIKTATKTTNEMGLITTTKSSKKINEVRKIASQITKLEEERNNINKSRSYPTIDAYGFKRDTSFVKFFDTIDCRILRIAFLGNTLDTDSQKAISNIGNGILNFDIAELGSVVGKFFYFMLSAFPYGIIITVTMIAIFISMIMVAFRAVQTFIVGVFGLVVYIYLSPLFFILKLFPTTEKAFDNLIKNFTGFIIIPPISFVAVGIYITIAELGVFGDKSRYSELFDFATGSILSSCYEGDIDSAPLSCIATRMINAMDSKALLTGISVALMIYFAGAIGSKMKFAGAKAITGKLALLAGGAVMFGINSGPTFQYMMPFIFKLVFVLILIYIGVLVIDEIENVVKSMIGITADTSLGGGFEGNVSVISGIQTVGAIGKAAMQKGLQSISDKIKSKVNRE